MRPKKPKIAMPGQDQELDAHIMRQAQKEQQKKMHEAGVQSFVMETGKIVYGQLMAGLFWEEDLKDAGEKELQDISRLAARYANFVAPYYAEQWGLVNVPDKEEKDVEI